MDDADRRAIRLTDRDREILAHIGRHRLTTMQAVHRLFFPGLQAEAAESTLRRLREAGFIESRRLFEAARYYYLTKLAANEVGCPDSVTRPPGPQSITAHFGVLAYCCLMTKPRRLLTFDEFRTAYPTLHEPGLPSSRYYVDDDDPARPRLGWIEVDVGANIHPLVRKCHHRISRRLSLPSFRELIREKGFLVVLVTGNAGKAEKLKRAIDNDRPLVEIRLAVCPDLGRLTTTAQ